MNNWTLHKAIKNLKKGEELFIGYDNNEHTFTFTKDDKSKIEHQNDIYITSQGIWLDCNKICFMKTRPRSGEL